MNVIYGLVIMACVIVGVASVVYAMTHSKGDPKADRAAERAFVCTAIAVIFTAASILSAALG